jgi:hypothetical protein
MRRNLRALSLAVAVAACSPTLASAQADSPRALLDAWVELWGSYDLAPVYDLFVADDRLTYFSSEYEGMRRGFSTIVEHHRSLDFVEDGGPREGVIWVDDVEMVDFGSTVLIGAIWYFGNPQTPDAAQRGPMTMLAVAEDGGYRIGHMHFATYAESGG